MKNKYLVVVMLLASASAFSQENPSGSYIYFTTGNTQKGKLESADEEKIITRLESGSLWPGQRNKFMIFFSPAGYYLTEMALSKDPEIAKKQIQNFNNEKYDGRDSIDVIIKAVPKEVIAGRVRNVLNGAINYLTLDRKPASVNTENVFAVVRFNGSFEVFKDARDISEIADNLTAMEPEFRKARLSPLPKQSQSAQQVLKPVAKAVQTPAQNKAGYPADSGQEKKETAAIETTPERKKLSAEDQVIYQAKSKDKMEELASLLNVIVDNRKSRLEKDIAIQKALKMFVKGSRVEVSAINNTNSKSNRAVEDYLDRLSRLNYSKVDITYAELNFIEEFTPDGLGNYWGIAAYVQTFDTNKYRDLTPKKQKVKLQRYEKIVNGDTEDKFEVLLGNISINVGQ